MTVKQDPLALRKRNYARKKRQGLCVVEGCYEKADGGVRCRPHRERNNKFQKEQRANRRENYRKKRESSMCVVEGCKEQTTGIRCEKHRIRELKYRRRVWDSEVVTITT